MSFSLLDSVKNYFSSDFISKASAMLGENNVSISKAVSAGIPTVLSGIVSNAQSEGGSSLLNLAKQAASSGMPDSPDGLFSGAGSSLLNSGSSFISSLFGNNSGVIGNLLSNFSGIKSSTATTLLSAIAPIALGFIGKEAATNNLSASGLTNWLGSQKQEIANALPAGFSLPSMTKPRMAEAVYNASKPPVEKTGPNWLLWLLIAVVLIALLWYLMRSCNKTGPVVPPADTTAVITSPDTMATLPPVRESLKVKLPDGTEIDAWKGGIEDKLVLFLNDASAMAGKDVWFDFDDLNFETGSSTITTESQKQINNIAAILKAYPKAKIKIGGYTDRTGDSTANLKLSVDRAKATSAAIKAAGASGAQLLGAEGYGSQYAKAMATDADDLRKLDRHISVSVREK